MDNRRDARQLSDRELMLQVYNDVQWIKDELTGNGREGVLETIVRHDERILKNQEDIKRMEGATPRERQGIVTGISVGVIALALTVAKWLGFEVPG